MERFRIKLILRVHEQEVRHGNYLRLDGLFGAAYIHCCSPHHNLLFHSQLSYARSVCRARTFLGENLEHLEILRRCEWKCRGDTIQTTPETQGLCTTGSECSERVESGCTENNIWDQQRL